MEDIELRGAVGQPIELPISVGPATGYSWQLNLPPGITRLEDGPAPEVSAANRLGSAVRGAIRIMADKAGSYLIEAQLARPWDPEDVVKAMRFRLLIA